MSDIGSVARKEIKEALSPHFLGYEYDNGTDVENLNKAVEDVFSAIKRLLQQRPAPSKKMGATVMTESASMRTGRNGLPGIAPRTL